MIQLEFSLSEAMLIRDAVSQKVGEMRFHIKSGNHNGSERAIENLRKLEDILDVLKSECNRRL